MARGAKRATSRIEDVVGGGVSRLGGGLESLGEGIGQLGERVEKVPLLGQSVKDLGVGLADIGGSCGPALLSLGRLDEAEVVLKRSVVLVERAAGPDSPLLAQPLVHLAGVKMQRGQAAEAVPLTQRARGLIERDGGATSLQMAEALDVQSNALARLEPAILHRVIQRSAELHVQHICTGGDPFEFGSARPLDFGHWAAHKLEQLSKFRVSHGGAVAVGMAKTLSARLAEMCRCTMSGADTSPALRNVSSMLLKASEKSVLVAMPFFFLAILGASAVISSALR